MTMPAPGELQTIGMRHKTDKAWRHYYLDIYEKQLSGRRSEIKNILEIGVAGGASLRTWRDYFPNACVTGLDRSLSCAKLSEDRVKIKIGDASRRETLTQFADSHFDLIVDDGDHDPTQQIIKLCYLWSKLKGDGLYFIEDIGYTCRDWRLCIKYFEVFRPQVFLTHKTPWSVLLMLDKRLVPQIQKGGVMLKMIAASLALAPLVVNAQPSDELGRASPAAAAAVQAYERTITDAKAEFDRKEAEAKKILTAELQKASAKAMAAGDLDTVMLIQLQTGSLMGTSVVPGEYRLKTGVLKVTRTDDGKYSGWVEEWKQGSSSFETRDGNLWLEWAKGDLLVLRALGDKGVEVICYKRVCHGGIPKSLKGVDVGWTLEAKRITR